MTQMKQAQTLRRFTAQQTINRVNAQRKKVNLRRLQSRTMPIVRRNTQQKPRPG